jgi:hypothetical protein
VMMEEHQLLRIRKRNRNRLHRESEGFIVPFEGTGQHNPARGKGPCFVHATKERRVMEIAERLSTPQYRQDATEGALL